MPSKPDSLKLSSTWLAISKKIDGADTAGSSANACITPRRSTINQRVESPGARSNATGWVNAGNWLKTCCVVAAGGGGPGAGAKELSPPPPQELRNAHAGIIRSRTASRRILQPDIWSSILLPGLLRIGGAGLAVTLLRASDGGQNQYLCHASVEAIDLYSEPVEKSAKYRHIGRTCRLNRQKSCSCRYNGIFSTGSAACVDCIDNKRQQHGRSHAGELLSD